MCPLTGRALPSARPKCQHAVFCSAWQEPCSGCPLMTLKHLLLSGKWICLSGVLSSLFFYWINWSNRRLSYPPCHAFYLSLIALSFPASLCLSTSRQYLHSVSLLCFFPSVCQPFTQTISNLFVFPVFFFFYSVWPLFPLLPNDYSFYGLILTVLFTHQYSKEVLISLPVPSASPILLFSLRTRLAFMEVC